MIALRLGIVILVGLATCLLIWTGRSVVARQRRLAFAAAPIAAEIAPASGMSVPIADTPPVHILAFSSEDCHQCHQLQTPALRRVVTARQDAIKIVEVDATTEHQLVQTYHVMTVPSTVVLDAAGNVHAVNYGFANTQRLLEQVDTVLAMAK